MADPTIIHVVTHMVEDLKLFSKFPSIYLIFYNFFQKYFFKKMITGVWNVQKVKKYLKKWPTPP